MRDLEGSQQQQKQREGLDRVNLSKLSPAALALLATLASGIPVGAQTQQQELNSDRKIEQVQPRDAARDAFVKWFGEEDTKRIETEAHRKVIQDEVIPMLEKVQKEFEQMREDLNK